MIWERQDFSDGNRELPLVNRCVRRLFFFRDRNFVSDRSSIGSLSSANAAGRIQQLHLSEDLSPREIQENTFSLQAGIYITFLCFIM